MKYRSNSCTWRIVGELEQQTPGAAVRVRVGTVAAAGATAQAGRRLVVEQEAERVEREHGEHEDAHEEACPVSQCCKQARCETIVL